MMHRLELLKYVQGYARANSLRPAPVVQMIMAGVLALAVGSIGHYIDLSRAAASLPQAVADAASPVTTTLRDAAALPQVQALMAAATPSLENVVREVELDDDQSFAEMLVDAGVAETEANAAMAALAKTYNPRKMHAGQDVNLYFTRTAQDETLTAATFMPDNTHEVTITRDTAGTFAAIQKVLPIVRQRLAAAGEIHSTLYEAGSKVGVPRSIMAALMRVYAHDVDFQRDVHSGDRFEVMYDQPMTAQGKPVGEGAIIYASLRIGGKEHPLYRVTFNDNSTDYFDASGHSVRRALLRTPVAAAHVTSGFGMRIHPLLGYSKMHKGIDFGAPTGTPIFAAGSGIIEEIGPKNGYGRFVLIRHNGQMETAYAHMSRFSPNLFRGAHVNQGQVIGYVGMSGRATGPHLHFEVRVAGKQVNPIGVNMPTGRTLDGKLLAMFKDGKTRIDTEFDKAVTSKNASPTATRDTNGLIPASVPAPDQATATTKL